MRVEAGVHIPPGFDGDRREEFARMIREAIDDHDELTRVGPRQNASSDQELVIRGDV